MFCVLRKTAMKPKKRILSIKLKLTLWYTVFFAATISLLSVLFILEVRDKNLDSVKSRLYNCVLKAIGYVDAGGHGKITVSGELEQICDLNNVDIVIFDSRGKIVYGREDIAVLGDKAPANKTMEFVTGGITYYYYDIIDSKRGVPMRIRGITSAEYIESTYHTQIIVALSAIPLLLLISAAGGYFLTKRALRPITDITEAANKIESGNDLSQRIMPELNEKAPHDEIFMLSHTFNRMFEKLQESFEAEKQFTSNASHELRTPIAVIKAKCEYLMSIESRELQYEKTLETLPVLMNNASRMSVLVSRLLFLSRADKESLVLNTEHFDLSDMCGIICDEIEEQADERKITVRREITPDLFIVADKTLIMRAVLNLMSNGIKYGRGGGFVRLSLIKSEKLAVLSVADNGIGISAEHLRHIWERFYRVSEGSDGYGLGLPIVRWITEAHGGIAAVSSVPDAGSEFTITLPLDGGSGK